MSDWLEAEKHAQRAHDLYEEGQWDRALDELRLAIEVRPDKSEWHFGMGLALDRLHRFDEAVVSFEKAVDLGGDNADLLNCLGIDLIRTGQDRRAVGVFERITKIDRDRHDAYCHRILAYTRLGDYEKADEMFYLAQQINEACPACFDHIAQSLALRGQSRRAVWCWQQTLRLDPTHPGVRGNLALAHWRLGALDRARRLFMRQLRVDAGDIHTLIHLAYLLLEMRRYAEAAEKFRRVVELEPTFAEAHTRLGDLALRIGHYEAAARRFGRALRLDPEMPGARLGLARVAHHRGDAAEARDHLMAELAISGQDTQQVLDMARLLIELDLPEEALRLLTPMAGDDLTFETDEQAALALIYRGVAFMMSGELELGLLDCRSGYRLDRRHRVAMHNIILAHLELGELRRAAAALRRLRRDHPADPYLQPLTRAWRRCRWRQRWRRMQDALPGWLPRPKRL